MISTESATVSSQSMTIFHPLMHDRLEVTSRKFNWSIRGPVNITSNLSGLSYRFSRPGKYTVTLKVGVNATVGSKKTSKYGTFIREFLVKGTSLIIFSTCNRIHRVSHVHPLPFRAREMEPPPIVKTIFVSSSIFLTISVALREMNPTVRGRFDAHHGSTG